MVSRGVYIVHNYGAMHVESPWSTTLQTLSTFLLIGGLAAAYIVFALLLRKKASSSQEALNAALIIWTPLVVLIFVLADKVLSPQFLIWLAALVPLLFTLRSSNGILERLALYAGMVLVVAAGITQWIFPHWYAAWWLCSHSQYFYSLCVTRCYWCCCGCWYGQRESSGWPGGRRLSLP